MNSVFFKNSVIMCALAAMMVAGCDRREPSNTEGGSAAGRPSMDHRKLSGGTPLRLFNLDARFFVGSPQEVVVAFDPDDMVATEQLLVAPGETAGVVVEKDGEGGQAELHRLGRQPVLVAMFGSPIEMPATFAVTLYDRTGARETANVSVSAIEAEQLSALGLPKGAPVVFDDIHGFAYLSSETEVRVRFGGMRGRGLMSKLHGRVVLAGQAPMELSLNKDSGYLFAHFSKPVIPRVPVRLELRLYRQQTSQEVTFGDVPAEPSNDASSVRSAAVVSDIQVTSAVLATPTQVRIGLGGHDLNSYAKVLHGVAWTEDTSGVLPLRAAESGDYWSAEFLKPREVPFVFFLHLDVLDKFSVETSVTVTTVGLEQALAVEPFRVTATNRVEFIRDLETEFTRLVEAVQGGNLEIATRQMQAIRMNTEGLAMTSKPDTEMALMPVLTELDNLNKVLVGAAASKNFAEAEKVLETVRSIYESRIKPHMQP